MTPIAAIRVDVLSAIAGARHISDEGARSVVLFHLRAAASALLPLVQQEEDALMREHLREAHEERDTLPAPAPDERDAFAEQALGPNLGALTHE